MGFLTTWELLVVAAGGSGGNRKSKNTFVCLLPQAEEAIVDM